MSSDSTSKSIAVIGGTGAEGSGLARGWAKAGHKVVIGSRSPEKAAAVVAELNEMNPAHPVTAASNLDAAAAGDIVVLAVPFKGQQATATEVASALDGKILIDVTVPLVPPKVGRVQLPDGGSAVAKLQEVLGEGVRVVSAFQNLSAHHLSHLEPGGESPTDVLVCGDSKDAREEVIGLAGDLNLRGIHAGPICNSAAAEALTSLLIGINRTYKIPGAGIRITGI